MTDLGSVAWPPAPIKTARLVLREPEARDRAAFIELFASPEVGAYIGGHRPRDECERALPETPERRPGLFVIELDGTMIGTIELSFAATRSVGVMSVRMPGRPNSDTCSCRRHGDTGTPPRRARRRSAGSPTCFPTSRWCYAPRPPTTALCASRRSWGSPRCSGTRRGAPSSGWACGPRSRRPLELVPGRGGGRPSAFVVFDGVRVPEGTQSLTGAVGLMGNRWQAHRRPVQPFPGQGRFR